MTSLKLTVSPPFAAMAQIIEALEKDLGDWKPAFAQVLPILSDVAADNVRTQGGASGERWPALSPAYASRKAAEGHGRAALVYSGRMLSSMNSGRGVGVATKDSAEWVPPEPYALPLNYGSRKVGYPARPWTGLGEQHTERVLRVLEQRLDGVLARTAAAIGPGEGG